MTTTAVGEHEIPDIDITGAIEYRFTHGEYRILPFETPDHLDGHVGFREEGIFYETVSRVDRLFAAKIDNQNVVVKAAGLLHLGTELVLVLKIELHPFGNIRERENIVDIVVRTVFDQIHHQLIVADTEIPKPSES